VGNFTGESDYLYQREVVAANPKVYAQMVKILAPYSRVLKDDEDTPAEAEAAGGSNTKASDKSDVLQALAAAGDTAAPAAEAPAAAPARKSVRIRRADLAAAPESTGVQGGQDAPF
jgi:myo-inositol-1(or 4)-monophosphatase